LAVPKLDFYPPCKVSFVKVGYLSSKAELLMIGTSTAAEMEKNTESGCVVRDDPPTPVFQQEHEDLSFTCSCESIPSDGLCYSYRYYY